MNKPLIPPSTATHTTKPHNNDVLCGRGGTINAHPGNEQYRKFVERKKRVYLTARFKREKRLIAQSIIEEVRNLDPPGRFLTKDPHSDSWFDVGDEKARDKTSQALRENALSVRKQMEEEFQETRRRQARELAIAAGRDPDEAVKNMMSGVMAAPPAASGKRGETRKPSPKAPPSFKGQPPPSGTGFEGRSGYGPLYEAQRPALPQALAPPPPRRWPGYPGGSQPQHPTYHPLPSGGYNSGSLLQHTGFDHGHRAPPHPPPHYPYFQPPPPGPPPGTQQLPRNAQYSYGGPLPPQPQVLSHPAPSQQPHAHQPQPGMPPPPHHQHWAPTPQQPQPHQHAISQPMLAPRPSSQPPGGMPHPMIPSTGGHPTTISQHPTSPIDAINQTAPVPVVVPCAVAPAPPAAIAPPSCHQSLGGPDGPGAGAAGDPHVQFRNEPVAAADPRRGVEDIPLIISSKNRIKPRTRHPPSTLSRSEYSPDRSSQLSSSKQSVTMSPKSPGGTSQAISQGQTSQATQATLLSGDLSVKTPDSLSIYLRGIEDEITGDVGQEVELVAHAPMLEQQQQRATQGHHQQLGHHKHRQIAQQQRAYSRSTPPKHLVRGSGSSKKSSGSQRRKRRSGNHIPSNSGMVQVDWSTALEPAPIVAGGVVCGAGEALAPAQSLFVGLGAPVDASPAGNATPTQAAPVGRQTVILCGDNATASCGVILPTHLLSSSGQNRSPTTSAMVPTAGMPPLPTTPGATQGAHHTLTQSAHAAPRSPVHSLDLEKMSLCGIENVSQTGGSIGGASLCNVFDDHDGSVVGASALMDMTMSLGSHPSSAPSDASGLQPIPLGLNPQAVCGEKFSENESLCAQAPMAMSVGSGGNSHAGSKTSSQSGRSKSSSSRRKIKSKSSGRGSPASMDKACVEGRIDEKQGQQQSFGDEGREQPPHSTQAAVAPMYAHDFKFTWDGKPE